MTSSVRLQRRTVLLGSMGLAGGSLMLAAATRSAEAREFLVADAAQLRAALAAAAPGDRIVLRAGGTFAGDFVAARPGSAGAPVTIECPTILGATITGTFKVAAADTVLRGLAVKKGIELQGNRARASRCKVDASGTTSPVRITGGTGAVVEFCELTGYAARGLQIEGKARQPRLYRNWVHGQLPPTGEAVAAIISGTDKSTSATGIEAHILENLVENLNARQAIELKSSGNKVEGNTTIGTVRRPGDILGRHGMDNVFLRNWVENGRLLLVDERSIAVRNRCIGSRHGPCLGVMGGTLRGDDLRRGVKGCPISEDARVIANEAIIDVGWRYSGYQMKPVRTRVEAQNRTSWPVRLSFADPGQVTYAATTSWGPLPAAPRRLTRAEVGPFA